MTQTNRHKIQAHLYHNVTDHGEVGVVGGEAQAQLGLHVGGHSLQHAVKYMIVPLILSLEGKKNIPKNTFPTTNPGEASERF